MEQATVCKFEVKLILSETCVSGCQQRPLRVLLLLSPATHHETVQRREPQHDLVSRKAQQVSAVLPNSPPEAGSLHRHRRAFTRRKRSSCAGALRRTREDWREMERTMVEI